MNQTRRSFLKSAGAIAAGSAMVIEMSHSVAASFLDDRYIIDVGEEVDSNDRTKITNEDIEIIYNFEQIGYLVVHGTQEQLERTPYTAVPEWGLETISSSALDGVPTSARQTPVPSAELGQSQRYANDFPEGGPTPAKQYCYQWDKQLQNLPELFERTTGNGVRIGIVDTGIDCRQVTEGDLTNVNQELSTQFSTTPGTDNADPADNSVDRPTWTDTNGHGTHVAGIIGATGENWILGTAPEAELVAIRVSGGPFETAGDRIAGVYYAICSEDDDGAGCDVVNLSFGFESDLDGGVHTFYNGLWDTLGQFALEQDVVLVAGAGNNSENLDNDPSMFGPMMSQHILTVSATGPRGYEGDDIEIAAVNEAPTTPAPYTNYGKHTIDLSAPGGGADSTVRLPGVPEREQTERQSTGVGDGDYLETDKVLSTLPISEMDELSSPYGWNAGTSMAAPQVTGLVALVRSQFPDFSASATIEHIRTTAQEFDKTRFHGYGFINPLTAVSNTPKKIADRDATQSDSDETVNSADDDGSGFNTGVTLTGLGVVTYVLKRRLPNIDTA